MYMVAGEEMPEMEGMGQGMEPMGPVAGEEDTAGAGEELATHWQGTVGSFLIMWGVVGTPLSHCIPQILLL